MSEMKFVVRGEAMSADRVKKTADKKAVLVRNSLKTVKLRDEANASLGFIVLGYSPERWAEIPVAYKAHQADDKTRGLTAEEFTANWMAKNKPKRARSAPYALESSAEQCADMMRKAGWLHVRVDEILKG